MSVYKCGLLFISVSLSTASFDFHRRGWLDKVVEYHKNKLFEDFRKTPNVELKATIQPVPEGYVDSPAWDFDSVARLIILIRQSKTATPVRRVLRRMLGNTRRKISFEESFKYFPSLSEGVPNDIYYDAYFDEVVTEEGFIQDKDQGVIVVSNPVEARLPSAMISITLLRNILEERAKAARYMPTTRRTIPWKSVKKTTSSTKQDASKEPISTTKPDAKTEAKPETKTEAKTGAPATTVTSGTGPAAAGNSTAAG